MPEGRSILVTGAASGIGRATARLFSQRGYRVGCYDVDVDGARLVAEELASSRAGAIHGRLDVTQEESWSTAVADFASSGISIDVLFNCAGILRMGRFDEVSPVECRRQLDVNVMGVVLGVQACLPHLERSRGVVVNMSSASALYGQPELAVYSASKFAVRGLTEALDLELAARGVRVTDVMPSYVDTPMVRSQTHRARSLERLGATLAPEDIAQTVWKAAHGTKVHHLPRLGLRALARLGGLSPELARLVTRRITRPA